MKHQFFPEYKELSTQTQDENNNNVEPMSVATSPVDAIDIRDILDFLYGEIIADIEYAMLPKNTMTVTQLDGKSYNVDLSIYNKPLFEESDF